MAFPGAGEGLPDPHTEASVQRLQQQQTVTLELTSCGRIGRDREAERGPHSQPEREGGSMEIADYACLTSAEKLPTRACGSVAHPLFTIEDTVRVGSASCRASGARGPRLVGCKCTLLTRSLHEVMLILTMKGKWHSLTQHAQIWLLKITVPNKQTPRHFLRVNAKVLYKSHAHSFEMPQCFPFIEKERERERKQGRERARERASMHSELVSLETEPTRARFNRGSESKLCSKNQETCNK